MTGSSENSQPARTTVDSLYFWHQATVAMLVGIVALYFTFIAFGNITDYDTNLAFVKGVMSMKTTFQDPDLMWRAVTSTTLHHIAYVGIIVWEAATAVVCWVATALAVRSLRSPGVASKRAQKAAILGLLMSIFLWAGAFLTIGGEWFAMWQSEEWNGTQPALRNFIVSSVALIIVLLPGKTR